MNYYLIKPASFGRVDNYLTLARDYGDLTFYWQGVDMTVNARMRNGLTVQGGFTTGGGVRDMCELAAKLPELYSQPAIMLQNKDVAACSISEPWLWAWRGLANYIVPKVEVQVSAIMRSQPNLAATNDPASNGLSMSANYFERRPTWRPARASVAGNVPLATLDMARLGDVYPDRLNTVDMRVSKSCASADSAPTWASTSTTCSMPTPGSFRPPRQGSTRTGGPMAPPTSGRTRF